MKKIFALFFVVFAMMLSPVAANAVEFKPLLGLTVEKAFKVLEIAGEGTGFLIDYDSAKVECQELCVATEEIGKDTHLSVSFDKKTKAVREITLFVQIAYEGREAVMDAVIRAGFAAKMLFMIANPDMTDAQLKNLQNQVGILSEEVQNGKKCDVVIQRAKISGAFMNGVYMVNMGSSE